MKYLGLDVGTKRIGVAVSDDNGQMAFPRSIIDKDKKVLENIESFIKSENIEAMVIGLSVDAEGKDNPVMEVVNDLIGQLSFTVGIPIHLEQEAFTSMEARRLPGYGGQTGRNQANLRGKMKKKMQVDDSAAALILQRYLDKQ